VTREPALLPGRAGSHRASGPPSSGQAAGSGPLAGQAEDGDPGGRVVPWQGVDQRERGHQHERKKMKGDSRG
jgi:hypothetical protein